MAKSAKARKKPLVRRAKTLKNRVASKKRGLPEAARATSFKKGDPNLGRKKGVKNKLGVKLKEAILQAAEMSGRDGKGKDGTVGYLVWLSRAEPAVYGRMLEKIMPLQVDVRDKTQRNLSPAEAVEHLKERGLPVPESLNSLAQSIGRATAERQETDYDDELNGRDDPELIEDQSGDEEQDEAA